MDNNSDQNEFDVAFGDPFDCSTILGGEKIVATGVHVYQDGRFYLIGDTQSRVIGQIDGLTAENAAGLVRAEVLRAARIE